MGDFKLQYACAFAYSVVLMFRQDLLVSAGEMGSTGGQLLQLCGEANVDMKTQVLVYFNYVLTYCIFHNHLLTYVHIL